MPVIELTLGNIFLEIAKGEQKTSAAAIFKNLGFVIKHAIIAGKRASEHFNAVIQYADRINAIGLKGQAYLGLGILSKINRKYDLAGEYFEKSIVVSSSSLKVFNLSRTVFNGIGCCFIKPLK